MVPSLLPLLPQHPLRSFDGLGERRSMLLRLSPRHHLRRGVDVDDDLHLVAVPLVRPDDLSVRGSSLESIEAGNVRLCTVQDFLRDGLATDGDGDLHGSSSLRLNWSYWIKLT